MLGRISVADEQSLRLLAHQGQELEQAFTYAWIDFSEYFAERLNILSDMEKIYSKYQEK